MTALPHNPRPGTPTVAQALALAQGIRLPQQMLARLGRLLTDGLLHAHRRDCADLTQAATAPGAWQRLESGLPDDPGHSRLLGLYLAAACIVRTEYRQAGIGDDIFLDTMACFTRFVQESYEGSGEYAFTRGSWAWRQLSCRLFRLGSLEFEYRQFMAVEPLPSGFATGQPVLSVHIPSDAVLTGEALAASYRLAAQFFAGQGAHFCEQGAPVATICNSWLLSPGLGALLPPASGIRRFAADYRVYARDPDDESFYRWLFAGARPPGPLPQNTSLQRTVCGHLQKGGKIGAACGIYHTDINPPVK